MATTSAIASATPRTSSSARGTTTAAESEEEEEESSSSSHLFKSPKCLSQTNVNSFWIADSAAALELGKDPPRPPTKKLVIYDEMETSPDEGDTDDENADEEMVSAAATIAALPSSIIRRDYSGPSVPIKHATLREREQIARLAYKTWFRIKPGHKEVKDRWWALYYSKILPKFHLRDNHLGRKINEWIEEDLGELRRTHPEMFGYDPSRSGRKPKVRLNQDGTPSKKRKANSSKEGSQPAYLNVELVHPLLRPTQFAGKMEISTELAEFAAYCEGADVDFSDSQLDCRVQWFREHRVEIMASIPTIFKKKPPRKKARIGDISPTPSSCSISSIIPPTATAAMTTMATPTPPPPLPCIQSTMATAAKAAMALDSAQPTLSCNAFWVRADVTTTPEAVWVEADLPGVVLGTDFTVSSSGNSLVVKGERRPRSPGSPPSSPSSSPSSPSSSPSSPSSSEGGSPLMAPIAAAYRSLQSTSQRIFGPFELVVKMPPTVDLRKTEHSYGNGVLVVKCPLSPPQPGIAVA